MDNNLSLTQVPLPAFQSTWTSDDHWRFLVALVDVPDNIAGCWQKIADGVPGKTAQELKEYHDAWEEHLLEIWPEFRQYQESVANDDDGAGDDDDDHGDEDGGGDNNDDVEVNGNESTGTFRNGDASVVKSGSESKTGQTQFGASNGFTGGVKERKRASKWTVEEHRKFLEGLKVYGKGDWRSIARHYLVTRTSTQVASHAQKFFLRQKSNTKGKKRCSIHDITTTDATMVVHAQSTPSKTPTPPSTDIYSGQFFGSQEKGGQSPLTPQSTTIYGGQEQSPVPVTFCVGKGEEPLLLPIDFNYEQGGAPVPSTGDEFHESFIYYPY